MPGPLAAGAAGGGAAMPGPAAAAATAAAAGGSAAVPPGGVGVPANTGGDGVGWTAWAYGALTGARTFIQVHRAAVGVTGATVAVTGGAAA